MSKYEEDLLEHVKHLLTHKQEIQSEFHRDILKLMRNIEKRLIIRDLLLPVMYITEKRDIRYYNPVLEPLKEILYKSQISPKETYVVYAYNGKKTYSKDYINNHAGSYPTEINDDNLIIQGENPDIDSTSIATIIILDIGLLTKNEIEKKVLPRVNKTLKYLFKREFKITGLLQQGKGEDWAPKAKREGIVTYSNSIYLILLEKAIDLYISYGEKRMLEIVRDKISKIVDSMKKYLWYNNYFINGITPYGTADLTYILDTIYLGLTKTFGNDKKFLIHTNTLSKFLSTEKGFLQLNAPLNYNEEVSKINQYEDINGGIWIPLNIMYAYSLINNNQLLPGVKLLNKLVNYREYKWIETRTLKTGEKNYRLINNSLLLRTISKIEEILKKEKLMDKI